MTLSVVIIWSIVGLVLVNGIVSIAVAMSSYFSRRQKALQIAAVWALPVLGSIFIGVFLATQGARSRPSLDTIGARDLDSHAVQLYNSVQRGL
jgi:hypothetical protein